MNSIFDFVSSNAVTPVLKTWTAPKNMLSTWYAGKSGAKRLAKDKAAYDRRYLAEYEKAVNKIENARSIAVQIDSALATADDLKEIFLRYLEHGKEWVVKTHEKRVAKQNEILTKYGNDILMNANILYSQVKYDYDKMNWTFQFSKYYLNYAKMVEGIDDVSPLVFDLKEYTELRETDVVVGNFTVEDAVWNLVQDGILRLAKVLDTIKIAVGILSGLQVSRDADWGVGGHFNGIITNAEGKKVSFKSFLAGGWNIQREHIRFRITPLKG